MITLIIVKIIICYETIPYIKKKLPENRFFSQSKVLELFLVNLKRSVFKFRNPLPSYLWLFKSGISVRTFFGTAVALKSEGIVTITVIRCSHLYNPKWIYFGLAVTRFHVGVSLVQQKRLKISEYELKRLGFSVFLANAGDDQHPFVWIEVS